MLRRHHLGQPLNGRGQLASLIKMAASRCLHLGQRLRGFAVGRVNAWVEDGWVVAQVGQGLLDQRLELARRQQVDWRRSSAADILLDGVDASAVEQQVCPRLLAGAVARHRLAAGAAA